MALTRIFNPTLDGGLVQIGDGTVRKQSVRIEAGEYGTPFWLETEAGLVVKVSSLPWQGVLTAGQMRVHSSDPGSGDSTPPSISNPGTSGLAATSAEGTFDTDEGNGTAYIVATQSQTAPTASQVKNGQDHNGNAADGTGSTSVSATGTVEVWATQLTAATSYYLHMAHEDDAGNLSGVVTTAQITTLDEIEGGPNEDPSFAPVVGRRFSNLAETSNRGTGSFPWRDEGVGSEGWDDHERLEPDDRLYEASDSDAPFSPPEVVEFHYLSPNPVADDQSYTPGQVQTQIFTNSGSGLNAPLSLVQMYFRWAFKFGTNFQVHPDGMKMVFFRLYAGGQLAGQPFVKIDDPSGGSAVASLHWSLQGTPDNAYSPSALASVDIEPDIWYESEVHLVRSTVHGTTLGAGDGEIHQWLKEHPNGTRTKIYEETTLNLIGTDDTSANGVWAAVRFDPIFGGQGGTIDPAFSWWLDHGWISGSESF